MKVLQKTFPCYIHTPPWIHKYIYDVFHKYMVLELLMEV